MLTFSRSCAAAAVLVYSVSIGHAAILSCATAQGAKFQLSEATDVKCISGDNDAGGGGYFATDPTVFGLTGWTLADKNDGGGDGAIMFSGAPVNGSKSGDWMIGSFSGFQHVAIALKAGNGFGFFKLDTDYLSGLWDTTKGLSHASIWYTGTPDDGGGNGGPSPVPLPAAGWLLLAALGGLTAMNKRKT